MKTPKEWGLETGITILDPDGWRIDGKSFSEKISREEWESRSVQCTVKIVTCRTTNA